ncbi:GGDEF domain-containing protein [Arsenicicoccus dermatophilus]|uniref:GGDEF domain-containing protein n=1 Tax=Arsenicicoccus dermatophilus TaxID=1076331 RepID=UPI0039170340
MNPDESPTREERLLERLWSARYAAPKALLSGLDAVGDGPGRRVLEAFVAWREQRLDEVVATTARVLDEGEADPRWTARALGLQAGVLAELGLVEEAVAAHEAEVALARRSDDAVALAQAVHDLGVALQVVDPDRAARLYLEAILLARGFRTGWGLEDTRHSCAIEALAVVNLYDLHSVRGTGLALEVPGLEAAERLALRGWPELAGHIRAVRALARLDAGDVDGARRLAVDLPRPEDMRDVTNACTVVRVLARLGRLEGRHDEGRRLLESFARRLPDGHLAELLADLVELLEEQGDLAEADRVRQARAACVARVHETQARSAERALAVWQRVRQVPADAEADRASVARIDEHRLATVRPLTTLDAVSGLPNRLHLAELDVSGMAGAQLAVVDLDTLAAVARGLGREAADAVVRRVAAALRDRCGAQDLCVRYAEGTFVVARPPADTSPLAAALEPLTRLPASAGSPRLTASIGVVTVGADDDRLAEAIGRGLEVVARAREAGGVRVLRG